MAYLGVNVASRGEYDPAWVRETTLATFLRFVALPDFDARSYIDRARSSGLSILLILARESFVADDISEDTIAEYYGRHGNSVFWQVGNEPDHVSGSSWTMSQADFSNLLRMARNVMGPSAYITGGGLVSGNPNWLQGVDLSPVNAIACHPYAKDPWTPELETLVSGYAAYGYPLWASEYHARTLGMAQCLRDDSRFQGAIAFCLTDEMVPGFGMLEYQPALDDFRAAAAGAEQPP